MNIERSDNLINPFERTVCACKQCVKCCYDQPGSLMPGDMERIAAFLGETLARVKRFFWASPGALLKDLRTGRLWRVGTITPRRERGRCVFLDTHDRCRIHSVAPFACAYADTHMDREKGQQLGAWLARQQTDPAYQALREELPPAKSHNPRWV